MRIVLDTNILVSALITKDTPPDRLYRAWLRNDFELVTSDAQIAEVREVLARPRLRRLIDPEEADQLIAAIRLRAVVLGDVPILRLSPDPKDDFLLAAALPEASTWSYPATRTICWHSSKSRAFRFARRERHCRWSPATVEMFGVLGIRRRSDELRRSARAGTSSSRYRSAGGGVPKRPGGSDRTHRRGPRAVAGGEADRLGQEHRLLSIDVGAEGVGGEPPG